VNDDTSITRVASQWLVAAVLAILIALLSFSVLGAQITSEENGLQVQRRAAAALTDIDQVLPIIEPQLQEAAAGAEGPVRVPDYPLPIDLTPGEAATLQGAQLRARLLDESARILYEDGMSSWAEADPEARQDIAEISTAGAVYRGLGAVREDAHTFYVVTAIVLAVLCVAVGALLILTIRSGFLRLIAIGGVILAAALPCLAAAVGGRYSLESAQTDTDDFVDGLLEIGIDGMVLPIQMYLTMAVLGLAIIAVSSLLMWIDSRSGGGSYSAGTPTRPMAPPPPPGRP
jgi:hypothetical protein